MDTPNPISNLPEFSVSEISGAIKRLLEGSFGRVRVRGEITEFKRYPSGHLYFSLKDAGGKISGVCWKGTVARLGLTPENGLEIVATGKISSYGERSSYQLIVERMEYAGEGALLAGIERLRLRLAAEGLFDAGRKRALPVLPEVIGIVTSSQGAVLHDIQTTVARRFARRLLVWPVPVQGEGAAARIAAAIRGFEALPAPGAIPRPGVLPGAIPRPDVLIVARGGGSLEDLMAFNDEAVLRAVADCTIPLISAVGHETDTTLIDYVSDRRAPTPTAAAEMAVPMRAELLADLAHRSARLASALAHIAQSRRLRLHRASAALPDLPGLLGTVRQRLDDRAHRLAIALPNLLAARGRALLVAERHMPAPQQIIASRQRQVALAASRLQAALSRKVGQSAARLAARPLSTASLQALLRERRTYLHGLSGRLTSASPLGLLARGYALVHDRHGQPVTRAAGLIAGTALALRFADGQRMVRVEPDGERLVGVEPDGERLVGVEPDGERLVGVEPDGER